MPTAQDKDENAWGPIRCTTGATQRECIKRIISELSVCCADERKKNGRSYSRFEEKKKQIEVEQERKKKENLPLHLVGRIALFIICPLFVLLSTL